MLIDYKLGQGSIVLRVKIRNSSVTTGAGLTGLTFSSSGLIISTIANNEATATAYTAAGSTIETITTLGTYAAPTATKCRFKEVDSTNHKGIYEIQIADARFAVSSAKAIIVSISGATNAAECDVLIPLRSVDPYDGVRGGMTALPNAASGSAGGLIIQGTGTTGLNVSSGKAPVVQLTASDFAAGALGSVWEELASDHATLGTFGSMIELTNNQANNINSNVLALPNDVWNTALPASYAPGHAGYIIGTFLNAAINSRAVAGDAMTLANGAITDATITFPAEASGRPTTFLAAMRRLWEWTVNKRIRTRSTGAVQLRNAGDTADLETQTQSTTGSTGSEVDTQTKGA